MFERIKRLLSRVSNERWDERPEDWDDRDAGIAVPVRRRPPDHGSSVAVAEPDDEDDS
jgi:hypothetical protein